MHSLYLTMGVLWLQSNDLIGNVSTWLAALLTKASWDDQASWSVLEDWRELWGATLSIFLSWLTITTRTTFGKTLTYLKEKSKIKWDYQQWSLGERKLKWSYFITFWQMNVVSLAAVSWVLPQYHKSKLDC